MGNNFGPHGKFKPEIVITKKKFQEALKNDLPKKINS
jgi:hypothetical protein